MSFQSKSCALRARRAAAMLVRGRFTAHRLQKHPEVVLSTSLRRTAPHMSGSRVAKTVLVIAFRLQHIVSS